MSGPKFDSRSPLDPWRRDRDTMGRRQFLILSAVAGGAAVSGGAAGLFPVPASAQVTEWRGWPGGRPADAQAFRWGVPELWWYGKAQVFAHNCQIEYRADDATSFWVRGRARHSLPAPNGRPSSEIPFPEGLGRGSGGPPGGADAYFGVRLTWGLPLPGGHSYRFTARMVDPERLPDLITVNDAIVWRRDDGYDGDDHLVRFTYVPQIDQEEARICLVRAACGDWTDIYPPHQGQWVDQNLFSQQSVNDVARPEYEIFQLPAGTEFTGIDPQHASAYFADEYGSPVTYERPALPELPYPPAEVTFLERGFGLGSIPQYAGYVGVASPDTMTFQPSGSQPAAARTFANWADVAVEGGVKNVVVTPLLEEEPGVYRFTHLNSAMAGNASPEEKAAAVANVARSMASAANYWLDLVPDGKAYLFHVEMNAAHGTYRGGIRHSNIGTLSEYEDVAQGGSRAWHRTFDFFNDFRRQVIDALGDNADRVEFIANFDRAAFQSAYAYHSGVDLVLSKNIHRQSINVVTANTRGAARAYGRRYGYDFDLWDRQYSFSHHPDSVRHGLQVMFHAGAQYLMDEIRVNPWQPTDSQSLSSWGAAWLDFQRYVRTHPRLGEQQVRIAVMRGLGDEWNRLAGRSSSWEAVSWLPTAEMDEALESADVPDKWAKAKQAADHGVTPGWEHIYFSDFALLDLVFAEFGNPRRTEPDRLTTGTPYGPADIIPWDTPLERLKEYDLVIYLGRGSDTPRRPTRANLSTYVKTGGTLAIAAGQLKREDGAFDFDRPWLGVRLGERGHSDGLPYTRLEPVHPGAEVLSRLPTGDPEVVRSPDGKGAVHIFSGEWLTYFGQETPRRVLEPLLAEVGWLGFSPASSWLEYMVQRKRQTWVFPVFNHGRGWFPSGNGADHGVWSGTVSVDLERLGLRDVTPVCYRAVTSNDASAPVTLEPLPFERSGTQLVIALDVPELEELVIGRRGSVEKDYFA